MRTGKNELLVRKERSKSSGKSVLLLWKPKQGSFKDGIMSAVKCYVDLKIYEDQVKLMWRLVTAGDSFEGGFGRVA